MTDKQIQEKRKEFMNKWNWNVYDPEVPKIIWQWIEELIKEVEKKEEDEIKRQMLRYKLLEPIN